MAKKNIDELRNEDEVEVAKFLVSLFHRLGTPVPFTLCKTCKKCDKSKVQLKCPYSELKFMLAWLYSENIEVR